ncbi:MAG: phenylalanine--tRNA ligase subunit beta [Parvularcula sp.]
MKFTLSWLKKHLDTDASLDDIIATMVKVGLEVESIENPADRVRGISVGHVLTAEKHPDADKLKVCTVATCDGEKQIVCGAPNARAGIKVAYAPVGTYIAGIDVTLSKAKIRGVESLGMMCSARELELGDDHDGIMELSADAAIGTDLAELLDLNDPVIDFEVTPNRPDTNGVDGVARDLAAAGLGTLIAPAADPVKGQFPQPFGIEIDAPDACPAFAGRVIRGIKNGSSPQWLQDQLRAIGLRPINALVDITNFLSYDSARPLHVYDVSKLTGSIRARMGRSGETLDALDGKTYPIDETMCVIADEARVLGLGGVMGGTYSGCEETTTDVFIESALFDPMTTARTGRKTGIVSDARYRFERGVDPASVLLGLERATALVLEFCGGEPGDIHLAGEIPQTERVVEFPPTEVARLTGIDIPDSEKESILTALGFSVSRGGVWSVTVPSFRPDIEGKADLVEEIARIHGLDTLPSIAMAPLPGERRPTPSVLATRTKAVRSAMSRAGFDEAVTWAFCDGTTGALFGANPALRLSNPISSDLDTMRPSPLPNLLAAVGRNMARGAIYVRLFEVGGGYESDAPDGQRTILTAIAAGAEPNSWDRKPSPPDVFLAKRLALGALEAAGVNTSNLMTLPGGPDYFHPGRSGQFGLGPKKILARFGELHPSVLKQMDLVGPIAVAEVTLDAIPVPKNIGTRTKPALETSSLMPVRRDFAFVQDEEKPAEALLKAIKGAEKSLIADVRLFDVYRDEAIGAGKKSLALEVTLQPRDRTLTDEDIETVSKKIIAQAEKATGAILRG